jgi:GTPase SAR1 family protein
MRIPLPVRVFPPTSSFSVSSLIRYFFSSSFSSCSCPIHSEGCGVVLVYSINQRSSFERLEEYHRYVSSIEGASESPPKPGPKFILVGNKSDEDSHRREVSIEEGLRQAQEWGCHFYETSAKTSYNVHEMFEDIVRTLRKDTQKKEESHGEKPKMKLRCTRKPCIIL